MSIHGPYKFISGDGHKFNVEVIIDPVLIANSLAQKAKRSPDGIATAHSKGVIVKVTELPPKHSFGICAVCGWSHHHGACKGANP